MVAIQIMSIKNMSFFKIYLSYFKIKRGFSDEFMQIEKLQYKKWDSSKLHLPVKMPKYSHQ